MHNQDKYFKGQHKDEEFICFFRHHWITLLKEFVYFIVFITVVSLTISNIKTLENILTNNAGIKAFFVIGFLLGTVYLHRFFIKMFNHFVDIGIITDMRIIDHKKSIFFIDTMEAIDMANIQDIERKGEGLLPNILGYGDLCVYLAASSAVKIFHRIPNAKFHFRCISRQKEIRHRMFREAEGLNKAINTDALGQQRQRLMEGLKGLDREKGLVNQ